MQLQTLLLDDVLFSRTICYAYIHLAAFSSQMFLRPSYAAI